MMARIKDQPGNAKVYLKDGQTVFIVNGPGLEWDEESRSIRFVPRNGSDVGKKHEVPFENVGWIVWPE